ncbi:heat shock protein DnaJ domain-containing protein [Roseibium sp. TrichSKD4]|nr:heat shock protein DnaJ domain-containing protein [Roseibium sp. TrichSKD4]
MVLIRRTYREYRIFTATLLPHGGIRLQIVGWFVMAAPPTAFPLSWPETLPRTAKPTASRFNTNLNKAMSNVKNALRLFSEDSSKGVANVVICSNVTLGANNPADPGVAIWFQWDGLSVCIAVDRYSKVQDNVQAVYHILEARRTELRHGGLNIVRAPFAGFRALPSSGTEVHWLMALNIGPGTTPDKSIIEEAYRQLAKKHHPDAGGSDERMAELNRARTEALEAVNG